MQQQRNRLVLITFVALAAAAGTAGTQQHYRTAATRYSTTVHTAMGAVQQGDTLTATLSGAEEVPAPGDSTGTGSATVTLGKGQVCYTLNVTGLASPATAAHIHKGAAGTAGPIAVPFKTPKNGNATGCIQAGSDVIAAIRANPAGYYANVHTAEHPDGAIRGQLSAKQ